jgi:putative hemolysin
MKKTFIIVGVVCALALLLIVGCQNVPRLIGGDKDEHGCLIGAGYSWCEAKQKCIRPWEENCTATTQIANPASTFCIAQGGESKIITAADGSQSGLCVLPYGVGCDEWAFFRGECPASVNCTAEQKAAEVCTMEYMPVCGDDGVTYGNKCSACGSKNIDSYKPGECPAKNYITRDLEKCKVIRYLCVKGKAAFSDEFGCGCEPEKAVPASTCGNGVCDPGEATQCPECYYSTPPCLAPCTAGSCPDDCIDNVVPGSAGKLKANDCTEPRTQACTREYVPVCGWKNVSLECANPPCKATYANKCTACADKTVAYWTEGEC